LSGEDAARICVGLEPDFGVGLKIKVRRIECWVSANAFVVAEAEGA